MLKKILPLTFPPITAYLHYSYLLSIVLCNEKAMPWFYNNFIQLVDRGYKHSPVIFYIPTDTNKDFAFINRWMEYQVNYRDFINKFNIDIVEFVINAINSDFYGIVSVDEFYIPNKPAYGKYNLPHQMLIYGFDLKKKLFITSGFDKNNIYTNDIEVSFDNFKEGYNKMIPDWRGRECIYQIKCDYSLEYHFNKENVASQLNDYISGKNSFENSNFNSLPHEKYGVQVYETLKNTIEIQINEKKKFNWIPIHILWEHKKVMLNRLQFMTEHNYIKNSIEIHNSFKEIEQSCLTLRNTYLKAVIKNDHNLLNSFHSKLDAIKTKEITAIKRVFDLM